MNRTVCMIGASHRSAPIEERERLVALVDGGQGSPKLLELPGVEEAVVVSTCNRVEAYVAGEPLEALAALRAHVTDVTGLDEAWLRRFSYTAEHREAVRHLFRVSTSLDSLVVGEPQILGQLKSAFSGARAAGHTGPLLNRVFAHAFSTGKRVRTETRIAENAVSISYAAVELARKVFGSLAGRSVLVIGAGKMGGLATRHLRSAGVSDVRVVNRNHERAVAAAAAIGGSAHGMDELPTLLTQVDIVISCTGSQHYIIRYDGVQAALARRKYRPLFLIDIAVPRDIDPRCDTLSNVYLFDVDDLEKVVDANMKARRSEGARAESIVQEEVEKMMEWMVQNEVVPTIVSLRQKLYAVKDAEVARMLRENPDLPPEAREAVERMARSLVNKVLHEPTISLRNSTANGHHGALVSAVRSLFDLSDGDLSKTPDEELA